MIVALDGFQNYVQRSVANIVKPLNATETMVRVSMVVKMGIQDSGVDKVLCLFYLYLNNGLLLFK